MARLREHGGAAGHRCGDSLERCERGIADQGGDDRRLGLGGHCKGLRGAPSVPLTIRWPCCCSQPAQEESAMQDVTISPETRVRAVRARLPGQMLHERIENAQLTYGPLYTLVEIRQRVGEALPRRFGYVRSAVLEPIESYRALGLSRRILLYVRPGTAGREPRDVRRLTPPVVGRGSR